MLPLITTAGKWAGHRGAPLVSAGPKLEELLWGGGRAGARGRAAGRLLPAGITHGSVGLAQQPAGE